MGWCILTDFTKTDGFGAHYSVNQLDKKISQEGFDENGKPVDNFIYFREAQFKEGEQDWKEYLAKKMKAKTPVQRGAPKGSYQVIVRFMIDKEGIVTNATAETHFGYGMELEALRVISNSPKWQPLVILNKAENAYRRQPITFVVEEK